MKSQQMQKAVDKLKQDMQQAIKGATKVEVGITDPAVAEYATYVEFGWVQRVTPKQSLFFAGRGVSHPPKAGNSLVNPARPFFRGTIAQRAEHWNKLLKKYVKANGIDSLQSGLMLAAQEAQADIVETITRGQVVGGGETFAERSNLTMELYANESADKSKDGTGTVDTRKPLEKSGDLVRSIGWRFKT